MNKVILSFRDKLVGNEKIGIGFFALLFISICCIPDIAIHSSLPKFQLTDFLLPLALIYLWINKVALFTKFNAIVGIYASIILLSILVNARYKSIIGYFELYKLFKFLTFTLLIGKIGLSEKVKQIVVYVFYGLVAFNTFHYFNIFYFNEYVEPFFAIDIHLLTFGFNSIGIADTKRMLGTMGNPNNNAILLLFFVIFFLPRKQMDIKQLFHFFLSIILLFACQSRTAFLAILFILALFVIIERLPIKQIATVIGSALLAFFIVGNLYIIDSLVFNKFANLSPRQEQYFAQSKNKRILERHKKSTKVNGTKYLHSLSDSDLQETGSVSDRKKIWKHLWEMIKQKPLFGHAPYKEYFYNNKLYSENEFILITWRYGFVGLVAYLMLFLYPLYLYFINRKNLVSHTFLYFTIVILITSLTNNPISDPRILLLYATVLGWFLNTLHPIKDNEKTVVSR
jgi:O-antigen ligase